jgi:hypothetical protein
MYLKEAHRPRAVKGEYRLRAMRPEEGSTMDRYEQAAHAAIMRALREAGVKADVLIGYCIEVGLEAFRADLAATSCPKGASV